MVSTAWTCSPAGAAPGTSPASTSPFRPSLEDVLEFAIVDLGVDAVDEWRQAVDEGRRRWRAVQLRSAIRDAVGDDPTDAPALLRAHDRPVRPNLSER